MKKIIVILCAAVAFLACSKIETPATFDPSKFVFDFKINYQGDTKAAKAGWETGDKVFIFFEGRSEGYVTMTYGASDWEAAVNNGVNLVFLSEDGSHCLAAMYLPYGNDATPTYDSVEDKWTFSTGTDSYYLCDVGAYNISIVDGLSTLTASFDMNAPSGYIQFFIPDASASGTIRMATTAMDPAGLDYIDGSCNPAEIYGTTGAFITGYAATVNGEKGYYFSGKKRATTECYFAIEAGGNYYHYYKHLAAALPDRAARKLPALSAMPQVGSGYYVTIGSQSWSTVNYGGAKPWVYESKESQCLWPGADAAAWTAAGLSLNSGESVPTKDQLDVLMTQTAGHQYWLSLAGVEGVLCVDKDDASKYIFIPATGVTPVAMDAQVPGSSCLWSTLENGDNAYVLEISEGMDTPSYDWADNVPKTGYCKLSVRPFYTAP